MSDGEMVMFSGRVPKWMKQMVDADQKTNQQVLRQALQSQYGGERVTDIEQQIQEKERRKENLQQGVDWRLEEIEDVKQEIEALKRKKKRVESDKEELWQEALDVVTIKDGEIIRGEEYLAHHANNLSITVEQLRNGLLERHNE